MRLHGRYILGLGLLCITIAALFGINNMFKQAPPAWGNTRTQQNLFQPDGNGKFRCPISGEIIDFEMVNDDYCDCKDGGDEPRTSACPSGVFFCEHDTASIGVDWVFSSSRVNDGICDCQDGSDEYDSNKVLNFRLDDKVLARLGRGMAPCKDRLRPNYDEHNAHGD